MSGKTESMKATGLERRGMIDIGMLLLLLKSVKGVKEMTIIQV